MMRTGHSADGSTSAVTGSSAASPSSPSSTAAAAPAPASSCGAMALLDKYATLNSSIEDARKRNGQSTAELETTRARISAVLQTRRDVTAERDRSQSDIAALMGEVKGASSVLDRLMEEEVVASRGRDEAQRSLDWLGRYRDESREAFLARCRDFRAQCERHELRSTDVDGGYGDDAWDCEEDVYDDEGVDDDADDDCNCSEDGVGGNRSDEVGADASSSDPNTACGQGSLFKRLLKKKQRQRRKRRKAGGNENCTTTADEEIREARRRRRDATEALNLAKTGLDDATSELASATSRTDERRRKLGQARAQLTRVRREVENLESELERIDRETREARVMGEAYAKDACRRKRNLAAANRAAASSSSSARPRQSQNPSHPSLDKNAETNNNRYTPPACPGNRSSSSAPSSRYGDRRGGYVTPSPSAPGGTSNHHRAGATSSSSVIPTAVNSHTPGVTVGQNQAFQLSRQRSTAEPLTNMSSISNGGGRAATISNPYMKGPPRSGRQNAENDEMYNSNGGGRSDRITIEQQHPHRAGRIRVNRQFSTALQIMSGGGEDDDTNGATAGHKQNNRMGSDRSASVTKRMETGTVQTAGEAVSEDDDDCDDLLSYVAFGKKTGA